jgi:hypothetical protein
MVTDKHGSRFFFLVEEHLGHVVCVLPMRVLRTAMPRSLSSS